MSCHVFRSCEEVDLALYRLPTHVTERQRLGTLGAGAVSTQERHVPCVLKADRTDVRLFQSFHLVA